MLTLRRAKERHHDRRHRQEIWRTFDTSDLADAPGRGFGALDLFNESRLAAGSGFLRQPRREAEVLTYVRSGGLAFQDSTGSSGVIQAGEFQCMTAGRSARHAQTNVSRSEEAHMFQMWLRPSEAGLDPRQEQKRFSAALRRGELCLVASPDARGGSLRIRQDVQIYSTLLEPGTHVVHELAPGRTAWLQLILGEVLLGDVVLSTGDGAGIALERAVSLTAVVSSEILLLDLGAGLAGPQAFPTASFSTTDTAKQEPAVGPVRKRPTRLRGPRAGRGAGSGHRGAVRAAAESGFTLDPRA